MSSTVKLEDINSLIEQEDKNGEDQQSTSKMINQSSNNKENETGQASNSVNNVQKSKDKTDKEITNLTSIILSEKEPGKFRL